MAFVLLYYNINARIGFLPVQARTKNILLLTSQKRVCENEVLKKVYSKKEDCVSDTA